MTTSFNESDHPRNGDGKFAAKAHAEASDVSLGAATKLGPVMPTGAKRHAAMSLASTAHARQSRISDQIEQLKEQQSDHAAASLAMRARYCLPTAKTLRFVPGRPKQWNFQAPKMVGAYDAEGNKVHPGVGHIDNYTTTGLVVGLSGGDSTWWTKHSDYSYDDDGRPVMDFRIHDAINDLPSHLGSAELTDEIVAELEGGEHERYRTYDAADPAWAEYEQMVSVEGTGEDGFGVGDEYAEEMAAHRKVQEINLGAYRSMITCSCGFTYATAEGKASANEAMVLHVAEQRVAARAGQRTR